MQISSAAVEQADQLLVDVPDLIGARSPYPDLGLGGMDALPGSSPLVIVDEPIPGRRNQVSASVCLLLPEQRRQRHRSL